MTQNIEFDNRFFDLRVEHHLDPCHHKVDLPVLVELLQLSKGGVRCEKQINALVEPVLQLADDGGDVLLHDVLEEWVEYILFFETCFELCLLFLE